MATTTVAPIITEQINQNFYVGFGSLHTIQDAVDAAVESGLPSLVIIPQGYGGGDLISDVVNGTDYIYITDQRGSSPFFYLWYNGQYQGPAVNLTGELPGDTTLNLNNFRFVITGTMPPVAGNGANASGILSIGATNGQDTTGAGTTAGKGAVTAVWAGHGGSAPAGSTNGAGGDLYLLAGYGGRGLGATGAPGNVYIQDEEHAPANVNSGSTFIGGHDQQHATMILRNGDLYAPNLTAGNATFTTALVDGSPVRTFENTGDPGTGVTYPPAGLTVSTGSGWGTSINPATFATWPGVGIPVSTGTAWGTSLPTSNVVLTSSLSTIFAGTIAAPTINIVDDAQTTGTISLLNAYTSNLGIGSITSFFLGRDQNPLNFIQLGFQFFGAGSPSNIGIIGFPGGSQATFDNSGNWYIPGILTVGSISCSGDVGVGGQLWTTAITSATNAIAVQGVTTFNADVHVDGTLYTGWDISIGRNLYVTADLNVFGGKNFVTNHPLNPDMDLVHGSLEGPEYVVFYRGEAATQNGSVEISLPDYFERLVMPEQRTVQLTAVIEEENEPFGHLAASRVKDGKFSVWSSESNQSFFWEVKAVRGDIPPLVVERPKKGGPQQRQTASEPPKEAPKKKAGKR